MLKFPKAKKLDERWGPRLFNICKNLQILKRVKPINIKSEQRRFLKEETENPKFRYLFPKNIPKISKSIDELLSDIKNEKNRIIKNIYLKRLEEIKKQLELIQNIGHNDEKFYEISKILYKEPNNEDFKQALKIYQNRISDNSPKYNAQEIKIIFNKVLKHYGIKDYQVTISKKLHLAVTEGVIKRRKYKPYLGIPPFFQVSEYRLQQLLAHEIETHIIRQENSFNSPLWILMSPLNLKNYIFCEEGLGIYNEKRRIKNLGSEIWGIMALYLSKTRNFRETFEELISMGLNKELAWRRSVRTFRGIKNCSNKNGFRFCGDFIYWRGYKLISEFLKKYPQKYQDLYIGKTNLEDLDLLLELIGPVKNVIIPKNLSIKEFI